MTPANPLPEDARVETLAAVDLGSNSFHMLVARPVGGDLEIIDKIKQRVALAEGLGADGWLDEEAQDRAIACLQHFGQRLAELHPDRVRAVGTNAFRAASNAAVFARRATRALGHPIEVVSGLEEARLVYLGAAHFLGEQAGRRLVVDIGGGSTELILGEGLSPLRADSLFMGHLGHTLRFFEDGRITKKKMNKAVLAARVELETIELTYRRRGWDDCVGSSGTALAVESIVRESGWSAGGITRGGLDALREEMLSRGHAKELQLPGMKEERRTVLAGGVAILTALFEALDIHHMGVSEWALREGVLYDLLGGHGHDDVRTRTIERLCDRCNVDREQAIRVERTAIELLSQVAEPWRLAEASDRRLLERAAVLHEIGLSIAYSGHHKHGAYLVANSDLPGFSRNDQAVLATLILTHRGKIRRVSFEALPPEEAERGLRLALLLRLSVLLHRARTPEDLPPLKFEAKGSNAKLTFPPGWLEDHPLTSADLERECAAWKAAGLRLRIKPRIDAG